MTLDISATGPEIFAQETLAGFQSPANPFIWLCLIYGLILTVSYMQMQKGVMVLGVRKGRRGAWRVHMGCGGGVWVVKGGVASRFLEIYIM